MTVSRIQNRKFTPYSLKQLIKMNNNKSKNKIDDNSTVPKQTFEGSVAVGSTKYNTNPNSSINNLSLETWVTGIKINPITTEVTNWSARQPTHYSKFIFSNADSSQSAGFIYSNYDNVSNNEYPLETKFNDKFEFNLGPNYDGVVVKLAANCLHTTANSDKTKTYSAYSDQACLASHTVSAGQMIIARQTSGNTAQPSTDKSNRIELSSHNPRLIFVNKPDCTLAYTKIYQAGGFIYSDYDKSTDDKCGGSITLTRMGIFCRWTTTCKYSF